MDLYRGVPLDNLIAHLHNAARSALLVQDACNLSGVVHDFSRVMALLSEISSRLDKGTEWKNHHPISVLYASKISSLTGSDVPSVFAKAYERCGELMNPESTELGWP